MGSTISLTILLPAMLMLGHSCATMSLRNPAHVSAVLCDLNELPTSVSLTCGLGASRGGQFVYEISHGVQSPLVGV